MMSLPASWASWYGGGTNRGCIGVSIRVYLFGKKRASKSMAKKSTTIISSQSIRRSLISAQGYRTMSAVIPWRTWSR
jgi:hypothetical protein